LDGSKLFEKDEPLLDGFKWKSGAEPDTQGIWAWSEVFIVNNSAGQKVYLGLFYYVMNTRFIF